MATARINITLPLDVLKILKKNAKNGEKSAFIAAAIKAYAAHFDKKKLIQQMIADYSSIDKDDLENFQEWDFTLKDGLDD